MSGNPPGAFQIDRIICRYEMANHLPREALVLISLQIFISLISLCSLFYVSISLPNAFLLLITEDIFLDNVDPILGNFVKIE